jgi:5-methylcytosine-specific restriction endonuclease McrA
MAKGTSQPGEIHLRIVEVMKRVPEGISGGQIRHELEKKGLRPEVLKDLHRRITELSKWFMIERIRAAQAAPGGPFQVPDEGEIDQKLRAAVLYAARGRCQMCGRTIVTSGITLVVTSKKARVSGTTIAREDLWAICEDCYTRKKIHSRSPHAVRVGARPRFQRCGASISSQERQHES